MAERLAPEQASSLLASRPERKSRGVLGWTGLALLLVVGILSAALLVTVLAHFAVSRTSAADVAAARLVPTGMPARVLVVLARPGQEVPMAGTLAELDSSGVQVRMITLTRGESQEPHILGTNLAVLRAGETQEAGAVLGVDMVTSLDFPDGRLLEADPPRLQAEVRSAVKDFGPSVILSAADLTGQDTDSQVVSVTSAEIAREAGSGVAQVWTTTRRWLLRGRPEGDSALPPPTVAVRVVGTAARKDRALAAHGTMSPALAAHTYPLADQLPAWGYYRFWDREYFSLTWGDALR